MPHPLDLSRCARLPNRELAEVLIKLKNESSDVPKTYEVFRNCNAKPIFYIVYHLNEMPHALVFLDLTDANVAIDDVVQEMKRKEIEVLEFSKPKIKGVIIDDISFPLMAGRSRIVIFRDLAYSSMMQGIRERFGSGGEALLYHIGFESGKGFGRLHREFAKSIGIEDPFEIFNKISSSFFQWAGFGIMKVVELKEEGGILVVHDNFECEIMKNRSKKPYSQFIRGVITGVLNELFNKEVSVVEDTCLAKGDDICRFKVSFKN